MNLLDIIREVRRHLQENGRVSLRVLRRQYDLDDNSLDELIEELVDVQRIARREENILAWRGEAPAALADPPPVTSPPRDPREHTPKHLAEKILQSKSALEGERKTITVVFADLKGSTALIEGLDPEAARAIVDPALQLMMDAVHRYEGYVAQVMGDGILALFGAPIAQEDHTQRALFAALHMHGNMGHALADALMAKALRVTVWNRTRAKAEPLASAGASVALSVGET